MKHPISLLAFTLTAVSAAAVEEVVQIHPRFDSGRVATNDLSTTDFAQWTNGVGATGANNVGWNESRGIWYSFIRFAGQNWEDDQVYGLTLADWHERLEAAGSVTLRGDVNWLEINPDFPGSPGVAVSVWLVPGLEIPEGSMPGFGNTWPWNYANSVKVTSFAVEEMEPLRDSWPDAEFDPVNTRDKMAYALQIDLTEAVKDALAGGRMSPTTPWGIVFFPEEMEDQLDVPNNPQWIDRRQTVLHGIFWEVVLAEGDDPDPEPPAAPSGLIATVDGLDRINLSWVDNSDDETGFRLEVSDDGGNTFSLLAELDAGVTAHAHTGLTPSTTFHYRVRAGNAAGASAWSNIAMATTEDEPVPEPPAAPSGLIATADGLDRINLSWVDNSDDETGFRLEVSDDGGSTFSLLAELDAGVTAHAHTNLSPSTTFHYRVRAENAAGASAWSNTAMATTEDEPEPTEWAGFAIDEGGWIDTGAFLGWVYPLGDYVYVLDLESWMYLPESYVAADGAWAFPIRF